MRLVFVSLFLMSIMASQNAGAQSSTKKKKVKYQAFTQLDFTATTVKGKIRSPEVFYIFQRRHSEGPRLIAAPRFLDRQRHRLREKVEAEL